MKQTLRTYRCKQCLREVYVGINGEFAVIEELKNEGCMGCGNDMFEKISKKRVSKEGNDKGDHTAS
ncbi:hypothetical protein D3C76_68180 [compost metagenome]